MTNMKLKNVKVGVRVELKEDYNHLKAGQVGAIAEDSDAMPYIEWDDYHKTNYALWGAKDGHCWAVGIEYLRKVK